MSNHLKLAKLLNDYVDEESFLYQIYCEKLKSGLCFSVSLEEYIFPPDFKQIIKNNFNIVSKDSHLRGNLNLLFLFLDNTYELKLLNEKEEVVAEDLFDDSFFSRSQFFKANISNQKIKFLTIKQVKTGLLQPLIEGREFLSNPREYADYLKNLVKRQLTAHPMEDEWYENRLKLWSLNLSNNQKISKNDFGIKNLIHLRQVAHHFHFVCSNNELLEISPATTTYQQQVFHLYKGLGVSKPLKLII